MSVIFLFSTLAFTGCSQYFYTPTNQQVLNYSEKGDVAISGVVDGNEGVGASAGYAITNHIAINSDFKFFERAKGEKYLYDSYMWDNELIVFNKAAATKGYFIQAINLGYGFGEIGRTSEYYGVNISRIFAQPSIGYKIKGFQFAASVRLASVKYDVRPWYSWDPDNNNRSLEESFNMPKDGGRYFFTEPALTIGYGYKGIVLRIQRSWANGFEDNFSYIPNGLAISLNANVNAIRLFNKE